MNEINNSHYRSGIVICKDGVWEDPVCFSANDMKTHLIDVEGNELHRWNYLGLPGDVIDPKYTNGEKGHLLVQYSMLSKEEAGDLPVIGVFGNKTIAEIDWDSNPVWEWGTQAPCGAARQNHDWQMLPNGNCMIMITEPRKIEILGDVLVGDQGFYEIDKAGNIVWKWMAGDHIEDFGFTDEGLRYLRGLLANNPTDIWGYLELNTMQVLGENKWYDAGYEAFHPDNIIVSSRKASFIMIIDKKTGKPVWKSGPCSYLDGVTHPDRKLYGRTLPRPFDGTSGQHKPHLIPRGLPGEGNLLILDNNGGSGYPPVAMHTHAGSRVLEVNPITREIVWDYTAEDSGYPAWTFFTSFIGSVQRLPNGNTLINEGMKGRIFQVTREGELVWEYKNAYPGTFPAAKGNAVFDPMIYRAQSVDRSWLCL